MKSELLVQDKQVVVPGQVLAKGMDFLPSFGTYRLNEEIRAQQLGLLIVDGKVLKSIPLAGQYKPKVHDVVIAKVEDILMSGWRLDIGGPYSAVLPLKDASSDYIRKGEDLTNYFDLDEHVAMKITQVTSQNLIDATVRGPGLRKLEGGRIVKVNPLKVPRLIGKRGSMVTMVKDATECDIVVGQNGWVWMKGEPQNEALAFRTVRMIEEKAHVPGLTSTIQDFLSKETGKKVEVREAPAEPQQEERPQRNERNDRGGRPQGGRPHNNRGPRRGPRRD